MTNSRRDPNTHSYWTKQIRYWITQITDIWCIKFYTLQSNKSTAPELISTTIYFTILSFGTATWWPPPSLSWLRRRRRDPWCFRSDQGSSSGPLCHSRTPPRAVAGLLGCTTMRSTGPHRAQSHATMRRIHRWASGYWGPAGRTTPTQVRTGGGAGCGDQPRGGAMSYLHQGLLERGRSSRAPGHFARTFYRRGG
jgi:hypothetical protein